MTGDPTMTQEKALGRYTILRELGRGAIGAVYAARDRSSGAVVALKALDPALFSESNANLAELFLENARSAARLRHRNIVRVFDSGEAGGTAYVAMELVEGESLRQLLDAGPLSIARAIQAFDDVASALAYAHEEKMVHRGVKPTNILVSPSGVAKIGDFGTGQIGEAALRYMSPEQVRRDALDPRSDLFSLGAVLYEMLTCRSPFEGKSPEQTRQNILLAKPPPPSTVNPYVSGALDALVLGMLARDPDKRPANARSVLRDLQRLEEGFGLRPAASAAPAEPRAVAPIRVPEPAPRIEPTPPQPAIESEPRLRESEPRLRMPAGEAFFAPDAPFMKDPEPRPQPPRGSGSSMLAALALMLALLSIGLTVVLYYSPDTIERLIAASGMQAAPATAAAPTRVAEPPPPPPPAPVNEAVKEAPATLASAPQAVPPVPLPAQPSPPEKSENLPAPEPEQPVIRPPAVKPTARVAQPQPAGTAKIIVAVAPRGELYIDGKHYGTTPPLTTLDLEPGMYRIEVRSGSRRPYVTYMTVSAGDERRIRHDFAAKPIRPPG